MTLEIRGSELEEVLRHIGPPPDEFTTEYYVNRQQLPDALKAAVKSYCQNIGFFGLKDGEAVREGLERAIAPECERSYVVGKVACCEVRSLEPGDDLLANLASVGDDPEVVSLTEYFKAAIWQKERIEADRVSAKRETERARAENKLAEMEQAERIEQREAEDKVARDQRERDSSERIAGIQRRKAEMEAEIKQFRLLKEQELRARELEGELELASKEADLEVNRRARQLQEREDRYELMKQEAEIGLEALRARAAVIEPLIGQMVKLPPPYAGVGTLIAAPASGGATEAISALVMGILSRELAVTTAPEGSLVSPVVALAHAEAA